MSYRRSLSFSEDEKDLLNFFDNNGKSDIVKVALKFYIDNKDNINHINNIEDISDSIAKKLYLLIGKNININNDNNNYVENKSIKKGFKLVK